MDESQLTESQRNWLEASKKIGPGTMTKSERVLLEKLYKDMLPREQQELQEYIKEKASERAKEEGREGGQEEEDPTTRMEKKNWPEPSEALKAIFSKDQTLKPRGPKTGPE